MHKYNIPGVQESLSLPHVGCAGERLHGIQGGYDLLLDAYHLNDLSLLGYTVIDDKCILCGEPQSFMLKCTPTVPPPNYKGEGI